MRDPSIGAVLPGTACPVFHARRGGPGTTMREIFPIQTRVAGGGGEGRSPVRAGHPVPRGRFWPKPTPPNIRIFCRGSRPGRRHDQSDEPSSFFSDGTALTSGELLTELITLCHEFGHFKSFNGMTTQDEWERYYDVLLEFEKSPRAGRRRRRSMAPRDRESPEPRRTRNSFAKRKNLPGTWA